jgi:hemerythrin-like domain-containing protein
MGRWIRTLETAMEGAPKHPVQWIMLASELCGLIRAHLEVEEEVLFPILDAKVAASDLRPPRSLSSPHPTKADTAIA